MVTHELNYKPMGRFLLYLPVMAAAALIGGIGVALISLPFEKSPSGAICGTPMKALAINVCRGEATFRLVIAAILLMLASAWVLMPVASFFRKQFSRSS